MGGIWEHPGLAKGYLHIHKSSTRSQPCVFVDEIAPGYYFELS